MPTWTSRGRLRPAFSITRLVLLILFWLWGLGGIGLVAILRTNGSTPAEGVGATEFGLLIEMAAVIWLGGLILLGLSVLMFSTYWIEDALPHSPVSAAIPEQHRAEP